ncbi:divergent protein kinase domain 2A-like [Amphiura filiformis]|uniref:divergent protein kinase domain 2A-like n=1 Tax=Amphiura filiformis TaxID=82378 RepID=UPI003B21290F
MKVRVICYPRKLLACFGFLSVVIIVIQISGYGLKDLEKSGKDHINFALPTLRNAINGHDRNAFQNALNDGDSLPGKQEYTRTDHERIDEMKPRNHIANVFLANNNKVDGLQIQMPLGNNMAADPSNIPSHRYHEVPPVFLEEDTCPACYGTSICDQFYAGHIKLDTETEGLAKTKHVYFGYWEGFRGNFDELPLPVVVKNSSTMESCLHLKTFYAIKLILIVMKRLSVAMLEKKIMHTKLASNSVFQMKYVRAEFYKFAHNHVTSVGLAMCASQRLLDNLTKMYDISTNQDTVDQSPDVAMLATAFVLNPEALVIKFCRRYIPEVAKYMPIYYGECGRMVVVEPGGTSLEHYLKESWQVRVDLALQILQMVEDFLTASPSWMLFFVDYRFDNLCVSEDGKIQLIDMEDVVIIDKEEIKAMEKRHPTPVVNISCNEECLFSKGRSIYEDPIHQCGRMTSFASPVMHMLVCQRLLSDLETTKYIRMFDKNPNRSKEDHLVGLLHDIPDELEPKLSELLYECVFESKPGSRMYAVKALKMLLGIVKKSFNH